MMLHDYQADLVRRFYESDKRRSLIVLPTGAGKTRTAASVIDHWPGTVVWVTDRQELVTQASEAMPSASVLIGSTYRHGIGKVTIVGVHTVARRDQRLDADLVVVDEAHLSAAPTWRKVAGWYPEARILGLTATCYRGDGGTLADLFDEVLAGPSVPELIARDYLCDVRTFADPADIARAARIRAGEFVAEDIDRLMRGQVMRGAVKYWSRYADRRTIAFATSKAHAAELHEAMSWYAPGLVISEDTPRAERQSARSRLASGELRFLVSIDALGIGFDCPPVEIGLGCRPTMSRGVYRQQVGRIMRTAEGKREAIWLDFAGNVGRHGLPTAPDITTLDGRVVPIPKRGRLVGLVNCPKCLCVYETSECSECHAPRPRQKRVVRTVAGTLGEVVGIEETGAQAFARTAGPEQRLAWCRKKLRNGWSPKQIATVHKRIFGCWPDRSVFHAA